MVIQTGKNSIVNIKNTSDEVSERINIECGDNCLVSIFGIDVNNSYLKIFMGNNARLTIEEGQMINGPVRIYMHEGSEIRIGRSCLFASCDIWSSDMHSIFDISSGERINNASFENRVG